MTVLELKHPPAARARAVGRALVGALFLVSGAIKTTKFAALAALLASKGLPASELVLALVIALELGGGIALVTGWKARPAAFALALFVVPATWLFHGFWSADAAAYANQLNHFLKNVAIFGALLLIAASQ